MAGYLEDVDAANAESQAMTGVTGVHGSPLVAAHLQSVLQTLLEMSDALPTGINSHLLHTVDICLIEAGASARRKDALWKHGGHPATAPTADLWNAEASRAGEERATLLRAHGMTISSKAEAILSILKGSTDVRLAELVDVVVAPALQCVADAVVDILAHESAADNSNAEFYKYKAKPEENISAEELEIREEEKALREQFPDYAASFNDIMALGTAGELASEEGVDDNLIDTDSARAKETTTEASGGNVLLTPDVVKFLCDAHAQLFSPPQLASIGGGAADHETRNRSTAFEQLFGAGTLLAEAACSLTVSNIDNSAAGAITMAIATTLGRLHTADSDEGPESAPMLAVEFRTSGNAAVASELQQLPPHLRRLMDHVRQLLSRWSDHGVLLQLMMICERILLLAADSPLAEALASLELLLRKAQDWEESAAREFSLAEELQPLANLVRRWRQLELKSWPLLLQEREKMAEAKAREWWLRLHSLIHAVPGQPTPVDGDEGGGLDATEKQRKSSFEWLHLPDWASWVFERRSSSAGSGTGETEAGSGFLDELLSTLEQFVRGAPLGQLQTRLAFVQAFGRQLKLEGLLDAEDEAGQAFALQSASLRLHRLRLSNVLLSLHGFYDQWSAATQNSLSAQRAPLAKQLKDQAKLAKWNEHNYYAQAESAEKSHRALFKLLKAYDEVLDSMSSVEMDKANDGSISGGLADAMLQLTHRALAEQGDAAAEPESGEQDDKSDAPKKRRKLNSGASASARDKDRLRTLAHSFSWLRLASAPVGKPTPDGTALLARLGGMDEAKKEELLSHAQYASKAAMLAKKVGRKVAPLLRAHSAASPASVDAGPGIMNRGADAPEDLCAAILGRLTALQRRTAASAAAASGEDGDDPQKAHKALKQQKKRALVDLLSALRAEGISERPGAQPEQLTNPRRLFELPDGAAAVEGCLLAEAAVVVGEETKATTTAGKRRLGEDATALQSVAPLRWLWSRAQGYSARNIAQLQLLRAATQTQWSPDLSASEVQRGHGAAEQLLRLSLQQRALLQRLGADHIRLLCCVRATDDASDAAGSDTHSNSESDRSAVDVCHTDMLNKCVAGAEAEPDSGDNAGGLAAHKSACELAAGCAVLRTPSAHDVVRGVTAARGQEVGTGDSDPDDVEFCGLLPRSALTALHGNVKRLEKLREDLSTVAGSEATAVPRGCCAAVQQLLDGELSANYEHAARLTAAQPAQAPRHHQSGSDAWGTASELLRAFDGAVEAILLAVQKATKLQPHTSAEGGGTAAGDDDSSGTDRMVTWHARSFACAAGWRLDRVSARVERLLSLLASATDRRLADASGDDAGGDWRWGDTVALGSRLLARLRPMLAHVQSLSRELVSSVLLFHKGTTKLHFVLLRLFRSLLAHGFCAPPEEREGGPGDATQFEDDVEGTGMGEGEGKQDVSEELDNEEQLLGLKGEQQEEKDDQKPEEDHEDKGMEMEGDFEGQMHDYDQKDDEDRDDEDSEEDELDKAMGELGDDEEVIDEKQWSDDSDDDDDDDDEKEPQQDKFERDAPMEGAPLTEEMRTKDDEDEQDDKGDDKGERQPEQQEEEQQDFPELEVNEDDEDAYEDKTPGVDVRQDEDEEGADEEGEGDDVPDDLNLDDQDGDEDGDEDGDAEMDDAGPADADEEEGEGGEEEEAAAGDADDGEDGADDDDEEESAEVQAEASVGADDGQQQDDEEDDEDGADTADAAAPQPQPEPQPDAHGEKGAGAAATVEQKTEHGGGGDDEDERGEDEEEQDEKAQEQEQSAAPEESTAQDADAPEKSLSQDDGGKEWQPVQPEQEADDEGGGDEEQSQQQQRPQRDQEMNPFRDPGDAAKQWQRRLQIIERDMAPDPADDAEDDDKEEDGADDAGGEADEPDAGASYEFTKKGEASATQALADAPPELEPEEQPVQRPEEEDAEAQQDGDGDEDQDGDGDVAMDDVERPEEPEIDRDNPTAEERQGAQKQQPKAAALMPEAPPQDEDDGADDSGGDDDAMDADADGDAGDGGTEDEAMQQAEIVAASDELDDAARAEADRQALAEAPAPAVDLEAQRRKLEELWRRWNEEGGAAADAADALWGHISQVTAPLAQQLCEQLRLVLEPTQRAKMKGDYRTGKRINMRKVITYIASQYRKDKIWMRRSAPSKRQYQIMVAIDDSSSMKASATSKMALQAFATLCQALSRLEVGDLGVVKFGEEVDMLHELGQPWDNVAAARIASSFTFEQTGMRRQPSGEVRNVMAAPFTRAVETVSRLLDESGTAGAGRGGGSGAAVPLQLAFFISDGILQGQRERAHIRRLARDAAAKQRLLVLVILDTGDKSIVDTKTVVSVAPGKMEIKPFLEDYPFPYYIILRDVDMLPHVLADALRQWFEIVQKD
eukprot:g849.t1